MNTTEQVSENEALRQIVAGIEELIAPHRVRDAIHPDEPVREVHKVHVRVRDIESILTRAEAELRPRSHSASCGCYWCGKFRRAMAILDEIRQAAPTTAGEGERGEG